jgi:hypothetical protein
MTASIAFLNAFNASSIPSSRAMSSNRFDCGGSAGGGFCGGGFGLFGKALQ